MRPQRPSSRQQYPRPSLSFSSQNTCRRELDTTARVSKGATSNTRDEMKVLGTTRVTFTRHEASDDEISMAITAAGLGVGSGSGSIRDRLLDPPPFIASLDNSFSCIEDSYDDSLGSSFYNMNHVAIPSHSQSDDEAKNGKDARALQESLIKTFPDSLRHIAADEAAAEALLSNDPVGAMESGYHRQFSELMLREVYSLLTRTVSALQARRWYVMRHHTFEFDRVGPRTLEVLITEESARNLSEWNDVWYHGPPAPRGGILTSVTVRPPRFMAGMLWNAEDRFLLGGTAFLEEARILHLRLPRYSKGLANGTNTSTGENSNGTGTIGKTQEDGDQTTAAKGYVDGTEQRTNVRFLLREYISFSKADLGCMVQTFSIIPNNVLLNITRNNSIQPGLIQSILEQCAPGAVTRAFPLSMLLPASSNLHKNSAAVGGTRNSSDLCSTVHSDVPDNGLEGMFVPLDDSLSGLNPRSLFSTATHRSSKAKSTWRQPLGDEVYLRFTNPKLYAWVIQRQPAALTLSTNIIVEYIRYSQRLLFRRKVVQLLRAVRTVQKFFRVSLGRKKRAVQRMLSQWRQLELDCRERLKSNTFVPTATDRITFIVATVLWEHIVTTDQYKLSLLEEQFSERRATYKKWCAQRVEESTVPQGMSPSSTSAVDPTVGCGEREMEDSTTSFSLSLFGVNKERKRIGASLHYAWISRWGDVLHRRFGWYIDPEELLVESHRQLLISLRKTILSMADVQGELQKTGKEKFLSLL